MSHTKTESLAVMMNETTARQAVTKINEGAVNIGVLLQQFHDQEGWKALGYATFKAACEKEFADIYTSRSQVYRLMQQARVNETISPGSGTPLPATQTEQLAKVEPSRQQQVYEKAGGKKATAASIKAVVAKVPAKKKKLTAAPKVEDKRYAAALERIGRICGKPVRASIENGILKDVTAKEAIFWAGLKDDQMAGIQNLVVQSRWKPSTAWKQVNKMVDGNTKLSELTNLAIAGGGSWEGDLDGFSITVKSNKRRS